MDVSIMDDSTADISAPIPTGENKVLESHPTVATPVEATAESPQPPIVEPTILDSTQTLAIPSNGSSPRKIEANRRNAKQSTGPKTSVGKAISSWNSRRHGLLSKRLPTIYGQGKKK